MCRIRMHGLPSVLLASLFALAHAHNPGYSRRSLPNGMQHGVNPHHIHSPSSSSYSASAAQSSMGKLGGNYGPLEVTGSFSHSSSSSSSGTSNVSPDGSKNYSYIYSGSYGTSYNYGVGPQGSQPMLPPVGSFAAAGSGVPNFQSLAAAGSGGCIGACPSNSVYGGQSGNVGQYQPPGTSQYPTFPPQPTGNFHQQKPSPPYVPNNQPFSGSGGANNYNGGSQVVSGYSSSNGAPAAFGNGGFGAAGYVGNGGQQGTGTFGAASYAGTATGPAVGSVGSPGAAGVYVSVQYPGGVQGSTLQSNAANGASSGGFASGNGGSSFSEQGVSNGGTSFPGTGGTGSSTHTGIYMGSSGSGTPEILVSPPAPAVSSVPQGVNYWGGGDSNGGTNPTASFNSGGTSSSNSGGTYNSIDLGSSGSPRPATVSGLGSASAETERPVTAFESNLGPTSAKPEGGYPGSSAGSESGITPPKPESGNPASPLSAESESAPSGPTPDQGTISPSLVTEQPEKPTEPSSVTNFPDIYEEIVEPLDGNERKRGSSDPDATNRFVDSIDNRFGGIDVDRINTEPYKSNQGSSHPKVKASYTPSNEGVNIDDRKYDSTNPKVETTYTLSNEAVNIGDRKFDSTYPKVETSYTSSKEAVNIGDRKYDSSYPRVEMSYTPSNQGVNIDDIKKVIEYGSKLVNPSFWTGPSGSKPVNLPFVPFNYFEVSSGNGPRRQGSDHNYSNGNSSPGYSSVGQRGTYVGSRQPVAPAHGVDFRFGEGIRTYSSGPGKFDNSKVEVLVYV